MCDNIKNENNINHIYSFDLSIWDDFSTFLLILLEWILIFPSCLEFFLFKGFEWLFYWFFRVLFFTTLTITVVSSSFPPWWESLCYFALLENGDSNLLSLPLSMASLAKFYEISWNPCC